MKRILSIITLLMCFISNAYCKNFHITYNEGTEQEYSLKFFIVEDAPGTVIFYDIEGISYSQIIETLEIPSSVSFEGKNYTVTTIDYDLWPNCFLGIKKIIIPSSVRWILRAFASETLEEVVFNNAPIEQLVPRQFSSCPGLKSVNFGNACKLTVLSQSLFEGCTNLSDVQLPESLIQIESDVFGGCSSLRSIVIPKNVQEISWAFRDCTSLQTIDLPESLNNISGAFQGCTTLKSIVIPKNVQEISSAFRDCISLSSVEFEGDAIHRLEYTFYNCKSLKSFSITSSSSYFDIFSEAFKNCTQLTSVDINGSNLNMLEIGDNAFENCVSLSQLNYDPSTLHRIGKCAFLNCSSLKEFTFGQIIYDIGTSAFAGCSELEEFKSYGEGTFHIKNGVLLNTPVPDYNYTILKMYPPGKKDTEYIVPGDITEIANGAFSGAINLEKVTMGENVTDLGVMAFRDCPKLKEVELPASINHIPSGTFMGCGALEEVNLPQNYVYIGTGAFQDCKALEEITLPKNVQVIGESSFINTGLKKVIVPEKVSDIRNNAFRGCTSLATVSLPAGVSKIGLAALQDCSSLRSINIPAKLDTIAERTFKGCTSLTEVVIPDAVKTVGLNAFEQCTSLKSVTTGNGVKTLEGWSFYDCPVLEKIVLGVSLDSIGTQAFDKDINIREIICLSPEPPAFPTGFPDEVINSATVTVPEGSEDKYYDDLTWAPMVEGWTPTLVESITIEGMPEGKITIDDRFQLTAVVRPENATYKNVIWESYDPYVAEVDEYGMVYATGIGETIITASADDESGVMAEVTVTVSPILVESVTIGGFPEGEVTVGDSFQLTAQVLPTNAYDRSICWVSDDHDVARIYFDDEGLTILNITGPGSTTIRAIAMDESGCEDTRVINAVAGVDGVIDYTRPFRVYNLQGTLLFEGTDKTRLGSLTPGIYILVQGNERRKFTKR